MKVYLLLALTFFSIFSVLAESIILDDGQILKREIHSMDINYIYCKTPDGTGEKISRDKVIRVVYKEINKEDLQGILTEEEKMKIKISKDAKIKELEKLKRLQELEKEKKKELAEKKKQEEEKKKLKTKEKEELVKTISEKDKQIERLKESEEEKEATIDYLRESEKQKDIKIANLEEQIIKLETEIAETNSVLESTKKDLVESNKESNKESTPTNKELENAKKEIVELKTELASQKKENIWAVTGRSAVLPGWGHFYLKQDTTGYIYSGLFWTTFLYTFYNFTESNSAEKKYNSVAFIPTQEGLALGFLMAEQNYTNFKQSEQKFTQSFSILSLIYIVQLTHAYFSGKNYSPDTSIGFKVFNTTYTWENTSSQSKNYELYYQFRF